MSFWHPSPERQKLVKFWIDCAQGMTVVLAIVAAAFTYWSYNDTRRREARKPYEEKKLALYLDAARIAAHLTAAPDGPDKVQTEERFWELYWGELAFVETK